MAAPPVFLPGESQGLGSLVGCRLWGHTESDMTEATAAVFTLLQAKILKVLARLRNLLPRISPTEDCLTTHENQHDYLFIRGRNQEVVTKNGDGALNEMKRFR